MFLRIQSDILIFNYYFASASKARHCKIMRELCSIEMKFL